MNEFYKPYEFIRDSYYGNGGYAYCNSYSYLIKHPRESLDFYNDRKFNANLENVFRPLQDLFLEPIWSASIDINTKNEFLDEAIKETKIIYRANQSLLDAKIYGNTSFSVAIDILENNMIDSNSLPTIKNVFPGHYIELNMNGTKVVSAKYYEYEKKDGEKIPVKVEYDDNTFYKRTEAWYSKEKTITLEEQDEASRITDFDAYQFGYLNKIGLDLEDTPSSFDLARTQKQLFNLDNQRLDTLRKNGWPVIVIQTDQELDEISLSQDTMLKVPISVPNMPEFLEADLTGVELTTEIMQEKKSTIYKIFTNGLFSDNIKYTSAMASKIATNSYSNAVGTLYIIFQDILNTMVQNIQDIYGLNTTFTIDYPTLSVTDDEIDDSIKETIT